MKITFFSAVLTVAASILVLMPSPSLADNVQFKNTTTDLCIDGYKRGADVNAARCRTAFKAQRWTLDSDTNQIRHSRRNLCLAVSNSNAQNGARLVLWPCGSGLNQKWRFTKSGAIQSVMNNKCIDLSKANINPKRGKIHMWDCLGKENQQWVKKYIKQTFKKK